MELRQRLKDETASLHDKIEHAFLLEKILRQEITLSDYQQLIRKFYGFISPCEALIQLLPCQSLIGNRNKTPWLTQDLHTQPSFDIDKAELAQGVDLPALTDTDQVLGYLYVMEGATLGGQVIAKRLKIQLHITPENGGRYFHGYGHETKEMWAQMCLILSGIDDIKRQNKVVTSAKDTFILFHRWIEKKTLNEISQTKELVE